MPRLEKDEAAVLLDRFRRYLKDHHHPVTRQRDLVAEVVFLSGGHLSVEEIQRQLTDRGETVGLATIYRTLEVLVKSGLVRAHDFGQGFRRAHMHPAAVEPDPVEPALGERSIPQQVQREAALG